MISIHWLHRQLVKLRHMTLVRHIVKQMVERNEEHIALVQRIRLVEHMVRCKHMVDVLSKSPFKDFNIYK